MRFVVDETCWVATNETAEAYIERLEEMLDVIDSLLAQDQFCCFSEDLFNIPVIENFGIYDLYADTSPIPISHELQNRIAVAFARLPKWQEIAIAWPADFEITIAGHSAEWAPSIAWAHAQTIESAEKATAALIHPHRRPRGHVSIKVANELANLWFVFNQDDVQLSFRWYIVNATSSAEELSNTAPLAFDNLDIVEGALFGIKKMSRPYRNIIGEVVEHLAILSDRGSEIFSERWQDAPARFGALGIELSDENGNTKSNRDAKKERTLQFAGKDRIFWWHTKISPHQDRIHFCPDLVPKGGRIIIGILCNHLTV